MNTSQVRPVDSVVGIRAGQPLGAPDAGSALAVDAFVATIDTEDLRRLAADATAVTVASIQP